jgi:hypothetical protein
VPEGVEALVGLCLAFGGEGEGEQRGCELGVPQGALDEPGIAPGCEPMGGVGMPEGREGHPGFGEAGPVCGCAQGALATGATHGGSRRRTVGVSAPGGGQEPGGVPMGWPGGAEQRQRCFGEGDGPVFGALPTMAMALKTRAIDVGALEEEGCMEPEAHARDRGAGDPVMPRGGGREEARDLLHAEDGGESGGGVRTQERQRGPVTLEDVRREEAEAAVAEAHGRGGQAVDVFAVQAIALQLLCGEAVRGCVGARGQQADVSDRGCLRPCACAAEVERRAHVLPQEAHEISPFVRRVGDV